MFRLLRRRSRRPSPLRRFTSFGTVAILAFAGTMALNSCDVPTSVTTAPGSSALPADIDFSGRVTRIVDGDTFWISGQDVRIRVWGLDAPETNRPGGAAATAAMTRLVSGQVLHCRQRDIDRFGRIVGQCFLPDGRDITREMIRSGTATEFCRFSRNYYGTC